MNSPVLLELRLTAVRRLSHDIHLFEFQHDSKAPLPEFEPGAHIDLHLPNGMIRPYSLALTYGRGDRFVVGVKLDPMSRGGSRYMHEELRVGTAMKVGAPRNNFPLAPHRGLSVFVAGGIGITPIFAMISHLAEMGLPWELHYAVRQHADAAFLSELSGLRGGIVHLHVDEESEGRHIDMPAIVEATGSTAHFYCCGPTPMLQAFIDAAAALPPAQVHYEYFSADLTPDAPVGGFAVQLAKSNRRIDIPVGQTITQALRTAGIDVMVSCEQGHCGACETRVISGTIDHRDIILTEDERGSGKLMMICVSQCKSDTLVLDL